MDKSLILPLSPSRLSTFRTCLLQAKFRYKDKLPVPKNNITSQGVFIHAVAEKFRNYIRKNKDYFNQKDKEEKFDLIFDEVADSFASESFNHIRWIAKNACLAKFDVSAVVGIEFGIAVDENHLVIKKEVTKEELEIDNLAEVKAGYEDAVYLNRRGLLAGKIDMLLYYPEEKLIDVRDIKTGFRTEFPEAQGKIYAYLALCLIPKAENVLVVLETPRRASPIPIIYSKSEIYEYIKTLVEEINYYLQTENFPPTPGAHCVYCPYVKQCTYVHEDLTIISTKEEAVLARTNYFFHKAQMKYWEEKAKDWVEQHGNIISGEESFGYHPITKTTIPRHILDQICLKLNIKTTNLNYYSTDVNKLISKNPILKEALEDKWINETTSRFNPSKEALEEELNSWSNIK